MHEYFINNSLKYIFMFHANIQKDIRDWALDMFLSNSSEFSINIKHELWFLQRPTSMKHF